MGKFQSFFKNSFNFLVVIAALGYFVDIYDLVLFGMLRAPSLTSLGLSGPELLESGIQLFNLQMIGMLVGGILWGILGDKKGRLAVLFGSILLYSVANIANGFVHDVTWYGVCRFLAGIGLAGELGIGVTLVSETISRHYRGYGVMMIACVGIMGALVAGYLSQHFDWRVNYFIGGGLGLALLILRLGAYESGLFNRLLKQTHVSRGDFISLFTNFSRFSRYVLCILIGLPIWYMVGILVTFSPEFAAALNVVGNVSAAQAITFCYTGLVIGDFASGMLSQLLKTRRKIILLFMVMSCLSVVATLLSVRITADQFYILCFVMGISAGYWALFVTVAAEQFGTNLRATVTTTVPNFVRGSVVILTILLTMLKSHMTIVNAGLWIGGFTFAIGFIALLGLRETFGRDLDFVEDTRM